MSAPLNALTSYRHRLIRWQARAQHTPLNPTRSINDKILQRTRPTFQPQNKALRNYIRKKRCRVGVVHGVISIYDFGPEVFLRLGDVATVRNEIDSF